MVNNHHGLSANGTPFLRHDIRKYVAVMLMDVVNVPGFRHLGSSMWVTGRQVSGWPLKFYLPQGQHEIFQP